MNDKSELIEQVLDTYGTRFNPSKSGWQTIRCPDEAAHAHGDQNPSCRLNLTLGLVKCMGCDLCGDGYNVVMQIEGIDFKQAKDQLGGVYVAAEASDWLL